MFTFKEASGISNCLGWVNIDCQVSIISAPITLYILNNIHKKDTMIAGLDFIKQFELIHTKSLEIFQSIENNFQLIPSNYSDLKLISSYCNDLNSITKGLSDNQIFANYSVDSTEKILETKNEN